MKTVLILLVYLINIYLLVFFARWIMSLVLAFSQYRPSGAAAVAFEFVYTVTDPPVKFLRRFIPDLRLGNVALDLSFIIVIIVLRIAGQQLAAVAGGM